MDKKPSRVRNLTLRSTVAVLYLALVLCRVPVTLGDLRQRILSRQLPYLNAIRELPSSLTSSLSASDLLLSDLDCQVRPTTYASMCPVSWNCTAASRTSPFTRIRIATLTSPR